ncbi:hypothetical protein EV122DRAFT_294997 [Schizophyllum commune]
MSNNTHQTPSANVMTRIPTLASSNHHTVPTMPQDAPYSGFNALPVELQGLIFEQYLPEFAEITPLRKVDSPVTLSLVCRDWRYIALTTPSLWSGMSIVVQEHASTSQSQKLCRQLERWLALSKYHPLFIRLFYAYSGKKTFSAYGGSSADALGLRVVSMLRVHAGRWRNVEFQCPSTLLKPLVDGGGGSYSSDLSVDERNARIYPQLRGFTLDVTNTPSTARAVDFRNLRLPLEALTQLHLVADHNRLLSLAECRDLLAHCPQLRRCTLNAELREEDIVGESLLPTAQHSQPTGQHSQPAGESTKPTCDLEQLSIQLRPSTSTQNDPTRVPQAFANFLDALRLDSLTDLTIEWMGNLVPSCDGASQLAQALARCTSLESLDLRYIPLTTDELLACLKGLGGLRSLALTYSMVADSARLTSPVNRDLLRALEGGAKGGPSSQTTLLPRLRTLRLVSHCSDVDEADVMRFLDRRCVGGSLRSFKLLWARRVSSDLQTRLTDMWCAVRGLEVDVDRFRYGRG